MTCCFAPDPDADKAARRDREITRITKEDFKEKQKVIQLLLLGTGESGKSTIRKQMQIIHINGFSSREREEKLAYMRRNIRDSIACIIAAMDKLGIAYTSEEAASLGAWVLRLMAENHVHNSVQADQDPFDYSQEFFDAVEKLWQDKGVQESFSQSSRYQLIDCAKYFLDRVHLFRDKSYMPTDQDILRCRIMTNDISDIQFDIKDGHHSVKFRVFDVGGQKGERKKWIQCFNNVTAILYLCDVSSFDLTLKEDIDSDRPKNRLLESLDTFQEVWLNRYLQDVSILLFINKIDQLEEKVRAGKSLRSMIKYCQQGLQLEQQELEEQQQIGDGLTGQAMNGVSLSSRHHPGGGVVGLGGGGGGGGSGGGGGKKKNVGPLDLRQFVCQFDFDQFEPTENDKKEFLQSFPRLDELEEGITTAGTQEAARSNGQASGGGKRRRKTSDVPVVHPETVKTACYVKNVFMKIAERKRQSDFKYEYHHHTCCCYYTCAVNTDNVKKVLEGCRTFIIDKHLERFGIL
ncbi:hypothetical protein BOX15_Mlig023675g1 [Macrostomum lignano]|uniref:Adenylate cyclase-stimulating G alpha protein n=2 Tax=Macrostomum lignano TaxID=282301 RepID=A0A267G5K2_9PLAT|nr:hypothetical protein BOX15_Mlig023675g1 [Macrostomum lignano]